MIKERKKKPMKERKKTMKTYENFDDDTICIIKKILMRRT